MHDPFRTGHLPAPVRISTRGSRVRNGKRRLLLLFSGIRFHGYPKDREESRALSFQRPLWGKLECIWIGADYGRFEGGMEGAYTQPLFAEAARLEIDFHLGYAELDGDGDRKCRFNTAILVDKSGAIVGKYRKIHLPELAECQPGHTYQNLEKYYFDTGDLGFRIWRCFGGIIGMCICYDRRWPETCRVLGLKDSEMIRPGYKTPDHPAAKAEASHLANFHNLLTMQAGTLHNATYVIAVAKAGVEERVSQIGQSCIIRSTAAVMPLKPSVVW